MNHNAMTHVRQIPTFTEEGHLYRDGDQFFLVYTAASGYWDACPTDSEGGSFSRTIVRRAESREAALKELSSYLGID